MRVTTHTKSNRGRIYRCSAYPCKHEGGEIVAGQRYYEWHPRMGGPRRQHVDCGYPRPSQLSSRKTAVVEDAVIDAGEQFGAWSPELPEEVEPGGSLSIDTSDLTSALEAVASTARDTASEYESGADGMPDALQYSPTAEAMRDVAQRLEEWADELENWNPSVDEDVQVPDDYDPEDEAMQAQLRDAWEEAVSALRQDAQDHLDSDSVPEYES